MDEQRLVCVCAPTTSLRDRSLFMGREMQLPYLSIIETAKALIASN